MTQELVSGISMGVAILIWGWLAWGHLLRPDEGLEARKESSDGRDHPFRGDLSAAMERIRALESENRELRKLPEASGNDRILPESRRAATGYRPGMAGLWPDLAGFGRIPPPIWPGTRIRRAPKPSGLKPGMRLLIEDDRGREEYGTVVCVFEHRVTVIMDESRKLRDLKWIRES